VTTAERTPAPAVLGPPGHEHLPPLPSPPAHDAVHERPPHAVPSWAHGAARHVAEALFADESGPPPADRLDWVTEDFVDFMARSPARARLILGACLLALTWLAPLFVWRFGPLSWLDVETRAEAMERLERSPLGFAALGAKAILCMIWFEHAGVQKDTRTEPTCLLGAGPS
jgi:hypothetical protein